MDTITNFDIFCIILLIIFFGFFIKINITFPYNTQNMNNDEYEDGETVKPLSSA